MSLSDVQQDRLAALTQGFTASAEAAHSIPGQTTSIVRAYGSLLAGEMRANYSASPEEIDDSQARHAGESSTGVVA